MFLTARGNPLRAGTQILLRVLDGNQKQILNQFYTVPNILVEGTAHL